MAEVNLKDWASKQSPYIKIPDGGKIEGVYKGAETVRDSFDSSRTKIRYHLEIDGNLKYLESMSVGLASQFSEIEEGEIVAIFREGEGRDTRYKVETVISKSKSTKT